MKRLFTILAALVLLSSLTAADWRQFRGSDSNSVANDTEVPIRLDDDENIAWKNELPGRGPSCPIVVDGRVIVTCSSGVRQDRLHVVCFNAESGKQLWHRQFWATGRTFTHPFSAIAAPTPASDGERVFAFYGSNDLICLDLDGNLQWLRGLAHDYPKAGNDVGMSSSPVVAGETVVVQIECQGDSFAAGIDTSTGETRWRLTRARQANYASPIFVPGNDKRSDAVLLQSPGGLTAHDPMSGDELWRFDESFGSVPSAVASGNHLYLPCNGTTVLKLSDQSDSPEIVWQSNRIRPGSASCVVHDGSIYALNGGVLKCGDADSGELLWQLRVTGNHWATPVIAGEHMYCVNQDGQAQVIKLSREAGEIVATMEFNETVAATPAIADGALYVRGDKHLWKIAAE